MAYQHDIFISYRRSPNVGRWVQNHLYPRLEARLNEISPEDVSIFCDFMMEEGANWPADIKRRVRGSRLLLTIWSANYFRSSWCMAEWQSFRRREELLGLAGDENPLGLVFPVRYADGKHFPAEASRTLCRTDFSELNYPDEIFKESAKYLDFDKIVSKLATDLVDRLEDIPSWQEDFPVIEPAPLPRARLERAVL